MVRSQEYRKGFVCINGGSTEISEKNIEKIFADVSYNLYICIAVKNKDKTYTNNYKNGDEEYREFDC